MGSIEKSMASTYKSCLTPKLYFNDIPDFSLLPEFLTSSEQKSIIEWAYLKSLLLEFAYPPHLYVGDGHGDMPDMIERSRVVRRHAFFNTRKIAPEYRFFVARTKDQSGVLQYGVFNHLCVALVDDQKKFVREESSFLMEIGAFGVHVTNVFPIVMQNPLNSIDATIGALTKEINVDQGTVSLPNGSGLFTRGWDDCINEFWNSRFDTGMRIRKWGQTT